MSSLASLFCGEKLSERDQTGRPRAGRPNGNGRARQEGQTGGGGSAPLHSPVRVVHENHVDIFAMLIVEALAKHVGEALAPGTRAGPGRENDHRGPCLVVARVGDGSDRGKGEGAVAREGQVEDLV